jgi:DNA-binding response OmpR family regulator
MNLHSLLLSSDEKTVRILRRVLNDLDIEVEHLSAHDAAIRCLTRNRYEAIILDCVDSAQSQAVLHATQASPVNKRSVTIVLVDGSTGLKGGFAMGAHFVLHKPISGERARSSFRAVRALMKRERRRQARIPIEVPVECRGLRTATLYQAKSVDVCEGGMAIQFSDRKVTETPLRFTMHLPGSVLPFQVEGEIAWQTQRFLTGVRFKELSEDQSEMLQEFLNTQIPDLQDDPPIACQLSDLSLGACYLETSSPFPVGTRVDLSLKGMKAAGVVRVMHPDRGMGIEFIRATEEHRENVRRMIDTLRANGEKSPTLEVQPGGPGANDLADSLLVEDEDPLLDLFRTKSSVPLESFLNEMRQQRELAGAK